MRILAFLTLLLSATTISAQSQSDQFKYRASYTLTYQLNSTDAESISSETMHLYIGDQVSKFMSRGRDLKDSIQVDNSRGINQEASREKRERTKTEFDYVIYKNRPEQQLWFHQVILVDHLRYQEKLSLFNWTILPDSRDINGYQAQKATTSFAGRDYTAWFTPEIPIPEGPYKFSGLPGLILEIKDSQDHYVFELAGFEELQNPVPYEPEEKAITTTKERLEQTYRTFMEDPFAALENANTPDKTVTIHVDEVTKQRMIKESREELARKDNPIELQ